jgi:hypothetical protein
MEFSRVLPISVIRTCTGSEEQDLSLQDFTAAIRILVFSRSEKGKEAIILWAISRNP